MNAKRIGIDLGTANSVVYISGLGIVLNEPTVVAVSAVDNHIVAVGSEAREMLGRTPENIIASRPMKDGVIADYVVTEAMLRYFIQKTSEKFNWKNFWNIFIKPEVMICVPAGVTQVEQRAVSDAALSAGARAVYIITEPLAAAIGAKIPIAAPSGNMIVDIGGGSTEAAVISLGGIVFHKSVRVAGNKIDEAILSFTRKKFNLIIGERTAEEIKINIGTALPLEKELKMEVRGRDSFTGMPRMVEMTSTDVVTAINPVLQQIIGAVKGVLEETPPELSSDIIDRGIVMAGGTSQLRNLNKLLTQVTGVVCHVAEEPMLCVAKGTGIAIENLDLYKRSVAKK